MMRLRSSWGFHPGHRNQTLRKQEDNCKRYYFNKTKYRRKMRFEELDKKIQDAAEQHHPAYDEKAWQKMKKLLDIHLPEEKENKRRGFLILFLFLLIGGGLFIGITQPWQKNKTASVSPNEFTQPTSKAGNKEQKIQPAD